MSIMDTWVSKYSNPSGSQRQNYAASRRAILITFLLRRSKPFPLPPAAPRRLPVPSKSSCDGAISNVQSKERTSGASVERAGAGGGQIKNASGRTAVGRALFIRCLLLLLLPLLPGLELNLRPEPAQVQKIESVLLIGSS